MSKRYWVFAVAFGLIVAADSGQAQDEGTSAEEGTEQQQQPAQALPLPLPVQIIEDDETAETREARENEAAQREKDDLVAQQGMNAATQAMNTATQSMRLASWVSAGLVGLGTLLLIWTLHLTRQANRFAREAVSVTREIGEAQTRAYLSYRFEIHEGEKALARNDSLPLDLVIVNKGQSPAFILNVDTTFTAILPGAAEIDPHFRPEIDDIGYHVHWRTVDNPDFEILAPGETSRGGIALRKEIVDGIVRRNQQLIAGVTIKFKDVFGREFCVRFSNCILFRKSAGKLNVSVSEYVAVK